ncbi:hypothetical protein IGI04_022550 [Brassica rapa subsp. trilocularis]|uniref:RING-type domain-containing protein n=1 Tax=Brassica rapa subsp. trilocularis TaxID=1813537 RepID=A0ABQ7M1B6_BRACM|nr:hypothetical protein IGI04_022550 [Brassica rapa subsp. trilocularis]
MKARKEARKEVSPPCNRRLLTVILLLKLTERKQITKMMCMKCMIIQPLGATCSNISCNSSMGKYFCKVCKNYLTMKGKDLFCFSNYSLHFSDEMLHSMPSREKIGIEYFHCMKCNACMSRTLVEHVCIEKCLEDNCSICHEYIFNSNSPVKALPCGHVMHSTCFQEYTCFHYTCPICSKSLDTRGYAG